MEDEDEDDRHVGIYTRYQDIPSMNAGRAICHTDSPLKGILEDLEESLSQDERSMIVEDYVRPRGVENDVVDVLSRLMAVLYALIEKRDYNTFHMILMDETYDYLDVNGLYEKLQSLQQTDPRAAHSFLDTVAGSSYGREYFSGGM